VPEQETLRVGRFGMMWEEILEAEEGIAVRLPLRTSAGREAAGSSEPEDPGTSSR